MRYFIVLCTALIVACSAGKTNSNSTEAKVKKQFEKMLTLVKKQEYVKLAKMIVYRGEDNSRKWKDVCNPLNAEELKHTEKGAQRITKYLGEDLKYTYKEYLSETESEGTWHVLIVQTTYRGESKERAFAFLEINGTFALGDID